MIKLLDKWSVFFYSILTIQIIYLMFSFFYPGLPGWKMFSGLERPGFSISDEHGVSIIYQKYLPTTSYALSEVTVLELSKFICHKSTHQQVIISFTNGHKFNYEKPFCESQKI